MYTTPYLMELHGGRFDGYCELLQVMPSEERLELPTAPQSAATTQRPVRIAVYERKEVSVRLVAASPLLVLRYVYIETRNERGSAIRKDRLPLGTP
jgi:hypothetical protein